MFGIKRRLDRIIALLEAQTRQGVIMSKELDDLTAAVAANTSVEASAVTLISGLADQIKAAANDPAAVEALATQISTSSAALAAAVAANVTPAPQPAT